MSAAKRIRDGAFEYGTIIVVIVVVVLVALIVWNVIKAAKAGGKIVGQAIGDKIVEAQTGIPVERQNFLRSLSSDIESNVTRVPLTGWKVWVSDSGVIDALNKLVSAAEARLLSDYYKQLTGESLRTEIVFGGYFTADSRKKIKTEILTSIV